MSLPKGNLKSLADACRRELIDVYWHAVEAVKPQTLIQNAVHFNAERNCLTVRDHAKIESRVDLHETNIHIIGGGKSVLGMALGLAEMAAQSGTRNRFTHGCLSLPIDAHLQSFHSDKLAHDLAITCCFGAHNNLPDDDAVNATKKIIDCVKEACETDLASKKRPLFLVLISGGGSACLTLPRFVSLREKVELIKFLQTRGADIVELNAVRRCLSGVKGGQLARTILTSHPEARILNLILSDVIGDPIMSIASGPTCLCADHLCFDDLMKVLLKYHHPNTSMFRERVNLSGKELTFDHNRVESHIVGNNSVALAAAKSKAFSFGYKAEVLSNRLQGDTSHIMRTITDYGDKEMLSLEDPFKGLIVLAGGEATVEKSTSQSWGLGGRCQEMALDYLLKMLDSRKDNGRAVDVFLAAGTDGQDGPTDAAGCVSSWAEIDLVSEEAPLKVNEVIKAKDEHNSHTFWSQYKPDCLIKTGLTGTNVMDLYMYLLTRVEEK